MRSLLSTPMLTVENEKALGKKESRVTRYVWCGGKIAVAEVE
jgi:hypothetical protein